MNIICCDECKNIFEIKKQVLNTHGIIGKNEFDIITYYDESGLKCCIDFCDNYYCNECIPIIRKRFAKK
jgi:hypothetical protein